LKKQLEAIEIKIEKKSHEELSEWYEKAANVREIRRRYVHGNLEFLPLRHKEPVAVSAPP
jgi:hypothetical protein